MYGWSFATSRIGATFSIYVQARGRDVGGRGERNRGLLCKVYLKPFYPLPEADWVIDHVLPNQRPTVTCAIETEAHFCHGWHGEVSEAFGIRRQGAASAY